MPRVTKIEPNEAGRKAISRLRVAAYCRVSTDNDDQLASLEAQKQHYEHHIRSIPEWEYAGVYYDEGISGTKKEKRAGLLRLLADCENGKIDFILTKSISRFVRNTMDCLEIIRKLNSLGVYIFFEKENINTQSMDGELMLTILGSLAENESISISQNNKWSIQRRFRNGTFKMASPPYGYDYMDGKLTIHPERATVVRRIFSEALSGNGMQKIANALNADGILARHGGQWHASAVQVILSNPSYTGDAVFQKTYTDDHFNRHTNRGQKDRYHIPDHHDPIVSREEFDAVAKILEQHRKEKGITKGSGKYQSRYLFSGRIRCAECGGTFKRRGHGKVNPYIAWCCSRHIRDISQCSMRFIPEDAIHRAFVVMMNKLIFGHTFILKPLKQRLKEADHTNISLDQIQDTEGLIEENSEKARVLTELASKGYINSALFTAQANELRTEAAKLRERKETLSQTVSGGLATAVEVDRLYKFVVKADRQISSFDEALFDRFVDSIAVYSPEEVGFRMKCGLTLRERLVR
jgi:site-specific DNA recombinase